MPTKMMDDKKLILEVEKNVVLYDKSHGSFKNMKKKNDIWAEIGVRLGCSEEVARKRWRNIRDAFQNYKKKSVKMSGDGASIMKNYKYENILLFLVPHLKHRETSSDLHVLQSFKTNDAQNDSVNDILDEEDEDMSSLPPGSPRLPSLQPEVTSAPSGSGITTAPSRKRRREDDTEIVKSILNYLQNKHSNSTEQSDEISSFFNSMTSTVRALPPRKRAEIKFKIHQIVHEAEMEVLYPNIIMPSTST